MSTVKIADHAFAACERGTFDLPVTYMANGYELTIPVHVVNGAHPGPKMLLTALSHGDATTGFECIRQVLEMGEEELLFPFSAEKGTGRDDVRRDIMGVAE